MKRILELDGLRGLAILAVFFHHALHLKLLWMGVDLFFVLSGFLITGVLLSMKDKPMHQYFSHFYGRRARRLLPAYALILILASLLFGISWMRHWYLYLGLMNLLEPLRISRPQAFDPLWSLAVEEQFYLVWPFIVYLLSEKQIARVAMALVVLAPVLRGVVHLPNPWGVYMLTPFRMDLLAMGSLLALAYRHAKPLLVRYGFRIGAALVGLGLGVLFALSRAGQATYANTRVGNVLIFEGSLVVVTGMMVWALGGGFSRWLRWPPLRYIGQISYSMYLVHLGILVLLSRWLHSFQLAVAGLAAAVVFASVSWYGLEKPVLHYKINL